MKRMIPLWIATLAGVTMVLSNFLPVTQQVGDEAGEVFNVLAAVAYVLGAGSLAKVHLSKLSARSPGWGYSVVTLLCFVVTLACGLLKVGSHPAALSADVAFSGKYEEEGTPFQWIYDYMLTPITSTLFALLAFYVASRRVPGLPGQERGGHAPPGHGVHRAPGEDVRGRGADRLAAGPALRPAA